MSSGASAVAVEGVDIWRGTQQGIPAAELPVEINSPQNVDNQVEG